MSRRETTDVVLVLRGGGEYTVEHVTRLVNQIGRKHPVWVYTDVGDIPGVETVPLLHGWPGWWSKMEMFRHPRPFLYMDLDTTVVRPLKRIIEAAQPHSFVALRDVYRGDKNPGVLQSSILYSNGSHRGLYEAYRDNPRNIPGGDQIFMEKHVENPVFWQDITDEISSFKKPTNRDPSVWIFHGKPRPWDVEKQYKGKIRT